LNASATGTEPLPRPAHPAGPAPGADPIFDEESGLWVLPDPDDGVRLDHFLDRAKPSLAEAAALGALVLDAVAGLHTGGRAHGELTSQALRVGCDGSIHIVGRGADSPVPDGSDADPRRADVRAAAGIVAEIAKSAGRPARPLTKAEERIAARLSSAGDPRRLARRGPPRAAHGLELVIGPAEQRRIVRQRLVALIRAVAAVDAPLSAGRPTADGSPSTDGRLAIDGIPASNGSSGRNGRCGRSLPPPARRPPIWPRVWKGAAIGAVVALVFGVEVRFFGHSVQHNVHVLLSGDVKGAAAAAGPRRPGPIPVLGPAAAAPVTHVELRPLEGCKAGSPACTAVLQLTVTPQDRPLDVPFGLEVVDRCRGTHEPRPGGVLSVPPKIERVAQTLTLAVPAGRAIAVVPVTSSPVRVAGTPMRLSPDDGPC
jgi:hypothetical protein